MYSYGVSLNSESGAVVMFEDISGNRLRELKAMLAQMEKMVDLLMHAKLDYSDPKSDKIRKLISPYNARLEDGETALLRSFKTEIQEINQNIVWVGEQPEPKPGINEEFDKVMGEINQTEVSLEGELEGWRERLGLAKKVLQFNHAKTSYAIEAPNDGFKRKGEAGSKLPEIPKE